MKGLSDMKFCPQCGGRIENYNFCPYCGHNLQEYHTSEATGHSYVPPVLPRKIEKMIASGKSYAACAKELKKIHPYENFTDKKLKSLVSTAGTKIMAEQSVKAFEKDFQFYRISPCGKDSCSLCTKLSKKCFRFSERKAGVNFPPFHDGCKCSFEIVVDNWDQWMDDYESKHKK